MIDKLKQVIQKANPEKEWVMECSACTFSWDKDIRLADVLIALDKMQSGYWHYIDTTGDFFGLDSGVDQDDINPLDVNWNLQKNNLDDQSDKTKQFLIDLLVK